MIPDRPVLVAGGAGFIGRHLCRALLENRRRVICVDNFCTSEYGVLNPFLQSKQFQLIEHDVTIPFDIQVSEIYNLACPASPVHYQRIPIETLSACFRGAQNLLNLAVMQSAKILQASTSEVYGDPQQHPQPEEYPGYVNLSGPRACYDEGKRCAETLFYSYQKQLGADIRVARIFNIYGPGMSSDDGRVVPNFIVQALSNKPIAIFGDGSQTRAFCFVTDLIDALLRLMRSAQAGPINLGSPTEISILDLALLIIKLTGSHSEIVFKPATKNDPRRRCPDIGRAYHLLGWRPVTELADGLEATIAYFREIHS